MRKNIKQKMDESLSELQEAQKRYDAILAEYNEQEEKARNKRHAERGKAVEKALPELASLTKKQFEAYLEKVMLSDDSRLILMEICAEDETPAAPVGGDTSAHHSSATTPNPAQSSTQGNPTPTQKPPQTAHKHNNGTSGNTNGNNNTGQNGGISAPKPTQAPTQGNAALTQKPAGAANNSGTGGNANAHHNIGQQV